MIKISKSIRCQVLGLLFVSALLVLPAWGATPYCPTGDCSGPGGGSGGGSGSSCTVNLSYSVSGNTLYVSFNNTTHPGNFTARISNTTGTVIGDFNIGSGPSVGLWTWTRPSYLARGAYIVKISWSTNGSCPPGSETYTFLC